MNLETGNMFIIGGQQKYLRPFLADDSNWYEYHKGVIIKFDPVHEVSEMLLEYTSPPAARAENGVATLFKSATIEKNKLYACTQTEVLVYSLPSFEQMAYVTLPSFNDVHHVRPTIDGHLAVASAGMDMVIKVSHSGEVLEEINVLGEDPWLRFSKRTDYRQLSTKPHKAHPNHLFYIDDELWSTRFYQRDAISLCDPARRIDIGISSIHDGLVDGDFIYFTTVNGNIVIANKRTLKKEQVVDLNEIHQYGGPLGWCRGILIDGGKMWVGFSRIRPTKLRENLEWVKRTVKSRVRTMLSSKLGDNGRMSKLNRELPSHLACYDLAKKKCIAEINLEPHGISAIFSIFPATEPLSKTKPARASERFSLA